MQVKDGGAWVVSIEIDSNRWNKAFYAENNRFRD